MITTYPGGIGFVCLVTRNGTVDFECRILENLGAETIIAVPGSIDVDDAPSFMVDGEQVTAVRVASFSVVTCPPAGWTLRRLAASAAFGSGILSTGSGLCRRGPSALAWRSDSAVGCATRAKSAKRRAGCRRESVRFTRPRRSSDEGFRRGHPAPPRTC